MEYCKGERKDKTEIVSFIFDIINISNKEILFLKGIKKVILFADFLIKEEIVTEKVIK